MKRYTHIFFIAFIFFTTEVLAQSRDTTITASIEGNIFKPSVASPNSNNVSNLKKPSGFSVEKFAEGLGKPRMMAINEDGSVYVTRREGDILMLTDTNGDGISDKQQSVLKKDQVHGLTIHEGQLYFIDVNDVYRAKIKEDGTLEKEVQIVEGLPEGGQHPNRTIEFGPDNKLYISVGSTCNACDETSDLNATLVVTNADGSNQRIFAKGLRNTIGFDWHPETKQLWGADHGIDWLGDNEQKEELNLLEDGNDYGWPYIYGDGKYNPADEPPNNMSYEEYSRKTTLPKMSLAAHSAPLDLMFYNHDQFPEEYWGDAIVTLHGSWNRSEPSGYKVVRIKFDENGMPTECVDFISGFLVEGDQAQFGRVTGLAIHPDGSMLISDDSGGVIYRVSYASN